MILAGVDTGSGNHDTLVYHLAQMLVYLNQGERLSPDDLADKFGVNLRTIQRDLNERFAYGSWLRLFRSGAGDTCHRVRTESLMLGFVLDIIFWIDNEWYHLTLAEKIAAKGNEK